MLISLLTYLLISNALNLRKDKSILFSRIVMVSLTLISFLAFKNLFVLTLDKGIGIFAVLLHITAFTQSFNIFILLISATILTLTVFTQSFNIFILLISAAILTLTAFTPNEWFSIANILTTIVLKI